MGPGRTLFWQKSLAHCRLFPALFRQGAFHPCPCPCPREVVACSSYSTAQTLPEANVSQRKKNEPVQPGGPSIKPGSNRPQALPRLILLDAFPLLFRYHFAYGNVLNSSEGESTSILHGFLNAVIGLLRTGPTHMVAVFDAPGKTFRHEMYAGYKAQRPTIPPEVKNSVPDVMNLMETMGIPFLRIPGIEADDIIGTLSTRAADEGYYVAIVSPDKDFYQLLQDDKVQILRTLQGEAYRKARDENKLIAGLLPYRYHDFVSEYNLQPSQWVDLRALSGDSSDNVPGVAGIGSKIAQVLLRQFASLDNLLENVNEVKGKKRQATLASEDGKAAALLSRQLLEIKRSLNVPPLRISLDEFQLHYPSEDRQRAVYDLLARYEFKKHAEEIKELWDIKLLDEPEMTLDASL